MALESIRSSHSELESIDAMLVRELDADARTQEEQVMRDHRVSALLNRSAEVARATLKAYGDESGALKAQLAAMTNPTTVLASFYEQVQGVKLYHAQHRHVGSGGGALEAGFTLPPDSALVRFSGEEQFGRYLDLHAHYERFVNLSKLHAARVAAATTEDGSEPPPRVDYHSYLCSFARFDDIAPSAKDAAYVAYLGALRDYLVGFFARCNPIDGAGAAVGEVGEKHAAACAATRSKLGVDLATVATAAALEALGAEGLKAALAALGLKCGGTVPQRAARLFATKGLAPENYPAECLAGVGGGRSGGKRRRRRKKGSGGGSSAVAQRRKLGATAAESSSSSSSSGTGGESSGASSSALGPIELTLRSIARAEFVVVEFAGVFYFICTRHNPKI